MLIGLQTSPGGLDTNEIDLPVAEEGVEQPDTVTTTADTGNQIVR